MTSDQKLMQLAKPMVDKVGIKTGDLPWVCVAKLLIYLEQLEARGLVR